MRVRTHVPVSYEASPRSRHDPHARHGHRRAPHAQSAPTNSAPTGGGASILADRTPTLRWLFLCFEGIDLHHTLHPGGTRSTDVLRLTKVHRLVLRLLGPAYEKCYLAIGETAE